MSLEWTYQAGKPDVRTETLEQAAQLLVLRHDTLRIIDGAGPSVEIPRSDAPEQESIQETAAGEAKASAASKEQPLSHDEVGETQRAVPSTHCSFSGPIKLEAASFLESKVEAVQCPTCGSVSKAKVKGQSVVILPHLPRKLRPVRNVTRWVERGTEWGLVQKKE